ncbi:MAG: hypothetical protein ACK5H1_08915 [Tenacibaculum sp.]
MALLKKLSQKLKTRVSASSLTEVLVATSLILLIFGITTASIDKLLQNMMTKNTQTVETELVELMYLYKNKKIELPYNYHFNNWNISILKDEKQNRIIFKATHRASKNKTVQKMLFNPAL